MIMKKNKKNLLLIISILLVIGSILGIILNDYIQKEKQEYDNYKDYTMGSIILTFNAMDNINHKYKEIRYQERYIKGKFTPIEDYIFDYISYDYIPIFKYIINKTNDEELILSISKMFEFGTIYKLNKLSNGDDIFISHNNKYYYKKDGYYYYETKRRVMNKEDYNKLYLKYNDKNIDEYFISLLFEDYEISNLYSKKELLEILNDEERYIKFYNEYQDVIINCVVNDLNKFNEYLFSFVDKDRKITIDIEGVELKLLYRFEKLHKIYNEVTKYSNYLYRMDLEYTLNQLEEQGFPLLYI